MTRSGSVARSAGRRRHDCEKAARLEVQLLPPVRQRHRRSRALPPLAQRSLLPPPRRSRCCASDGVQNRQMGLDLRRPPMSGAALGDAAGLAKR